MAAAAFVENKHHISGLSLLREETEWQHAPQTPSLQYFNTSAVSFRLNIKSNLNGEKWRKRFYRRGPLSSSVAKEKTQDQSQEVEPQFLHL